MVSRTVSQLSIVCRDCGESKPVSEFYRRTDRPEGNYNEVCKPCKYVRQKNSDLKRWYGISLDEMNEMKESQDGLCAMCGNKPCKRGLMVDHNHETGEVRELLCNSCNVGIGGMAFNEDIERLKQAIAYLEKWNDR